MAKKKLLIADDEEHILTLVKLSLEPDYDVVIAADGAEALKVFEKEKPDIVLLDLMMPKIDGYKVCKKIKQKSKIPVLILSAKGLREDILKGMDCGADDYITKPFDPGELVTRVQMNLMR
jgi:DNA-binding response OmpR family regulator